jgi:hypothetical protein
LRKITMPRRKANEEALPQPPAARPVSWRRWLAQAAVLTAAMVAIFAGVIWLGQYARDRISEDDRFQFAFADIDCQPPPGLERRAFLDEVLYHARCPERFSLMEAGLPERLKGYFAKHPWVARVDKVELQAPRGVHVQLTYRQPVLAVVVPRQLSGSGSGRRDQQWPLRGVDDEGVLLPKKAPLEKLPMLFDAPPPTARTDWHWGDAGVEAAARVAALLLPHRSHVEVEYLALSADGLVLWGSVYKLEVKPRWLIMLGNIKVLWGGPDANGDRLPKAKLQRLLDALAAPMPIEPMHVREIDVRVEPPVQRLITEMPPSWGMGSHALPRRSR